MTSGLPGTCISISVHSGKPCMILLVLLDTARSRALVKCIVATGGDVKGYPNR